MKTMNPIIEEIHAFRAEYARQYDYDLRAICDAARQKQLQSGHEIVSFFYQAPPTNSNLSLTNHSSGLPTVAAEFRRWAP
ncbi:hypothetical protein [Candidatus Symbiobacter mobilis]|uniref:Uncharacterized protein n=1 Tax=Candidatus Symbiobacter mobilis CR TaxID=946483 RepID=U5N4M2_9BURK|nr:hypothetical protein [Candidatus Symbiobacter mobilis]AGX86210.1 hypothetical protein Cenrod_0075 [Candidatus Symbiobacter mobilis CR]